MKDADLTPLLDAGDAPEFPEYDVVESSEVTDAAIDEARHYIDSLSDEEAADLAKRIRESRAAFCYRCPHAAKAGIVVQGVRAKFVMRTDKGAFGLCSKHGKKLYRRVNPPTMAVPKGRR